MAASVETVAARAVQPLAPEAKVETAPETAPAAAPGDPAPRPAMPATADHALTGEARRIPAMLAPLMSGLATGESLPPGTARGTRRGPPPPRKPAAPAAR